MADDVVTDAPEQVVNSGDDTQDQTTDATNDAGDTSDDTGGKTLLESTDDKPVAAPADWPEDWRAKLAGEDEKVLKRLERMKSPKDVLKSWRALETKLSSGDVKATLPEGATEEQVAEYRKENGIPDTPEGYLEALPNGLVVGEDDKEAVNSFLESAHGKNASPEFVASALDWYYERQEETAAQQVTADREYKQQSEDALRAEWGNEYRANVNSVQAFLDTAPVDEDGTPLKELLLGARLSDGTALGDNPLALKWLVGLAEAENPAGFVSPGAGGTQAESVEAEIAEIEKLMRTDPPAYYKDQKKQDRLLLLYKTQEKLSSRG